MKNAQRGLIRFRDTPHMARQRGMYLGAQPVRLVGDLGHISPQTQPFSRP